MAPTTPKKSPDAPHKNLRMTPQRQLRSSLGPLPNGTGAQRGRPKTSVDNRGKENSAHANAGLAGRSVQDAHNASASIAGSSAGSETVIPAGWGVVNSSRTVASRGMTASVPASALLSISISSASFDSVDGADPPSVVLPGGAGDNGDLSTDSKLEISQITYSSYDTDASEADGFTAVDAFAQTGASLKGFVTVKKEISNNCDEEQDVLIAITAKPEYEHLSFEELRLEHYLANRTSASNVGSVDKVDDVDGEELSNEKFPDAREAALKEELAKLLSRLKDMEAELARSDDEKNQLHLQWVELVHQVSYYRGKYLEMDDALEKETSNCEELSGKVEELTDRLKGCLDEKSQMAAENEGLETMLVLLAMVAIFFLLPALCLTLIRATVCFGVPFLVLKKCQEAADNGNME